MTLLRNFAAVWIAGLAAVRASRAVSGTGRRPAA
jgi:hypothetical protein